MFAEVHLRCHRLTAIAPVEAVHIYRLMWTLWDQIRNLHAFTRCFGVNAGFMQGLNLAIKVFLSCSQKSPSGWCYNSIDSRINLSHLTPSAFICRANPTFILVLDRSVTGESPLSALKPARRCALSSMHILRNQGQRKRWIRSYELHEHKQINW